MTPHLVKWQQKFADRGLTVIEVNYGLRDSLEDVESHIQSAGINFPVLYDNDGLLTRSYQVSAFPTALLVGRDGNILWAGNPFDAAALERRIEAAL